MPNVKLLRETLAHIEAEPRKWYQPDWRCGTGMCFAGWAVTLAGGQWKHGPDEAGSDLLVVEPGDSEFDRRVGSTMAMTRAQRLLGLTEDQADELFDGSNDLDNLRRIVEGLCAEEASV